MRRVVVDTETTGLEVEHGHRIVEVACLELNHRTPTGKRFHEYINPERDIESKALEVHGITREDLQDKPKFAEISEELFNFIEGAELVIHNSEFDLAFLNQEFRLAGKDCKVEDVCEIFDTLTYARDIRPGRSNSLDALANEYNVDLSKREKHGALLDVEILADVFSAMTSGQSSFDFGESKDVSIISSTGGARKKEYRDIVVQKATREEREAHEKWLDHLDKVSKNGSIERKITAKQSSFSEDVVEVN